MTPEEKIAKDLDAMRRSMTNTLRNELKRLYEKSDPNEETFDELLAEISDLMERYQGIL